MDAKGPKPASRTESCLTEHQQRRILSSFRHIDQLLSECESAIAGGRGSSLFGRYTQDLAPDQREALLGGIGRIRDTMRRILDELGIAPPAPESCVSWAIRTNLTLLNNVTIEELGARYMQGYGRVTEKAAAVLDDIRSRLQSQMRDLLACLDPDTPMNVSRPPADGDCTGTGTTGTNKLRNAGKKRS